LLRGIFELDVIQCLVYELVTRVILLRSGLRKQLVRAVVGRVAGSMGTTHGSGNLAVHREHPHENGAVHNRRSRHGYARLCGDEKSMKQTES
jgi:hypothetical protein